MEDTKRARSSLGVHIEHRHKFKSRRLRQLLTLENEDIAKYKNESNFMDFDELDTSNENCEESSEKGILTNIIKEVHELQSYVNWGNEMFIPYPGVNETFDLNSMKLQSMVQQTNEIRIAYQKSLGVKIAYAHCVNRFELEFDEADISKINLPKEFEFSSRTRSKDPKIRYITLELQTIVRQMTDYEDEMQEALKDFTSQIFTKFFEKKIVFDKFIYVLSEIDC